MGCDIHCYVEYRKDRDEWESFGGRINPGRNYRIFGRIADCGRGGPVMVPQRGIPDDLGYGAFDDWYMPIDYGADRGGCTPAEAARYVAQYGKRYYGDRKPLFTTTWSPGKDPISKTYGAEFDGKPAFVEAPDWHSPNWITPEELATVIAEEPEEIEYRAILAAMRSLEADGCAVRLVCWFDN